MGGFMLCSVLGILLSYFSPAFLPCFLVLLACTRLVAKCWLWATSLYSRIQDPGIQDSRITILQDKENLHVPEPCNALAMVAVVRVCGLHT